MIGWRSALPRFENRPKPVDDVAEHVGGDFRIIGRGVRRRFIPFKPCRHDRPRQHGLSVGDAAQCCGIKTAERMKRVALDLTAPDGLVQESQVE